MIETSVGLMGLTTRFRATPYDVSPGTKEATARRLILGKKIRPAGRAESSDPASNRNDRHDAERVRIDDHDLVANDDVLCTCGIVE